MGRVCDHYIDQVSGTWWEKRSGITTNTGWAVGHNANASVNGNLDITGYASIPGYVSQLTGWRIDNLGAADFRYLFTDELHAKSFIADLEQALAGGQIISKSVAVVAVAYAVPALGASAILTVKDLPSAANMAVFEAGDVVRLRTFSRAGGSLTIADSFGTVTGYADDPGGTQRWTYTRLSGANGGGMAGGTVIAVDALAIDYGVSGNGFYEVNAIDGIYGINSPYAQTATWTGSPTGANTTLRTRMGNLRGITGSTEYGAILGTYGTGAAQYLRASDQAFETHNLNLSMFSGATEVIKLDRTAPSFAIGSAVPTGYGTGTGIWMGNDGGTYKFRVGNPAGNRLTFDGTTLSVYGDGGGVTNIDGNQIQTNTIHVGAINATGFGDNLIKNGTFEGPSQAQGLAGWVKDQSTSSAALLQSCCGSNGPGTLMLDPTDGFYMSASYLASPVVPGQTYRLTVDVYSGTGSAIALHILVWQSSSAPTYVRHVLNSSATSPDVNQDSNVFFCTSCAVAAGWQTFTYTYTVPAGIYWISPAVYNLSGSFSGSAYTALHFDNIEMQKQIGTGHIRADAITTNLLAANAVTSPKITAGAITADKLNVTTLSAISADLGAVTAGSISLNSGAFVLTSAGALTTTNATMFGLVVYNQIHIDSFFGGGVQPVCTNNAGALIICP